MIEFAEFVINLAKNEPLGVVIIALLATGYAIVRNQERDDKTVNTALNITSTIVGMFAPIGKILEGIVKTQGEMMARFNAVQTTQAETQKLVGELSRQMDIQHQTHLDKLLELQGAMVDGSSARHEQHKEVIKLLDSHQKQMEQILRQITRDTDESTLRADMVRLVTLTTEIANGVKQLLQPAEDKNVKTIEGTP